MCSEFNKLYPIEVIRKASEVRKLTPLGTKNINVYSTENTHCTGLREKECKSATNNLTEIN